MYPFGLFCFPGTEISPQTTLSEKRTGHLISLKRVEVGLVSVLASGRTFLSHCHQDPEPLSLSPHLSELCSFWADSIWKWDPSLRVLNGCFSSQSYNLSESRPAVNISSLCPRNFSQSLITSNGFRLGSISLSKLITVAKGYDDLVGLSLDYRL